MEPVAESFRTSIAARGGPARAFATVRSAHADLYLEPAGRRRARYPAPPSRGANPHLAGAPSPERRRHARRRSARERARHRAAPRAGRRGRARAPRPRNACPRALEHGAPSPQRSPTSYCARSISRFRSVRRRRSAPATFAATSGAGASIRAACSRGTDGVEWRPLEGRQGRTLERCAPAAGSIRSARL